MLFDKRIIIRMLIAAWFYSGHFMGGYLWEKFRQRKN